MTDSDTERGDVADEYVKSALERQAHPHLRPRLRRERTRGQRIAIIVSVAAAAVAAIVTLATVASDPTLPIPAGTHMRADTTVRFTMTSVMTLIGAWASDGPVVSALYSGPGPPIFGFRTPPRGCGQTYNATLAPGTWALEFLFPGPANLTVTETFRLVAPNGNATVLPAGPVYSASVPPMASCP